MFRLCLHTILASDITIRLTLMLEHSYTPPSCLLEMPQRRTFHRTQRLAIETINASPSSVLGETLLVEG